MTVIWIGLAITIAYLFLVGGRERAGLTVAVAIAAFLLVTFFHGSLAGVV